MKARTLLGAIVMLLAFVIAGQASASDVLQKYFNDAAGKVKATSEPAQKREILTKSFQSMSTALDRVQSSPLVSREDKSGIKNYKAALQEKQDELAGSNGYQRVADAQLNSFSDYVVQDMEQAPHNVTISLAAAVLIIILLVLIL